MVLTYAVDLFCYIRPEQFVFYKIVLPSTNPGHLVYLLQCFLCFYKIFFKSVTVCYIYRIAYYIILAGGILFYNIIIHPYPCRPIFMYCCHNTLVLALAYYLVKILLYLAVVMFECNIE